MRLQELGISLVEMIDEAIGEIDKSISECFGIDLDEHRENLVFFKSKMKRMMWEIQSEHEYDGDLSDETIEMLEEQEEAERKQYQFTKK